MWWKAKLSGGVASLGETGGWREEWVERGVGGGRGGWSERWMGGKRGV